MKKSLTQFFSLIALAGLVFFTSCKKSEDAASAAKPTITLKDAGNGKYEAGDKAKFDLTASVPGGIKIVNFTKTVDGTVGAATGLTGVAPGDTIIKAGTSFNVDVAEAVGKTVTITVNITDNKDQTASATATYTVVAVGQGGGGAAPLLSGKATVSLGAEGAAEGSYLASSTGTVFKSADAEANKATIDITFGVGTTGGPSLISPDARTASGLNQTTSPRVTFFKAEANGPTDLGVVKAIDVENNVSKATTKTVQIVAGGVYSFVQDGATGKKGYIKVTSISGTGTARVANIDFVVQK